MSAPATARADAPNLDLMRKMGSQKGYDPMPPDQHQWQRAKHEPLIHRIWSVLCAHTIRAREPQPGQIVRTPYATKDDGKTPFMSPDLVTELDEDRGNVRRAWIIGEKKGLWRRDEKGRLWLNGSVTEKQVTEANERRKSDVYDCMTRLDLLKLKRLPKERQEEFRRVWEAHKAYANADYAEVKARIDAKHAGIEDNIRTAFGLDVRRIGNKPRQPVAVPDCLREFVQTREEGRVSTDHKNGFVQTRASLFDSEETTEVLVSQSVEVPEPKKADGPTDPPLPSGTGTQAAPEATPPAEDADLARVADIIHAQLGRACPGQHVTAKLCRDVLAALEDTPPDYYAAALRVRAERAIRRREPTSLGLALPLARETVKRWRIETRHFTPRQQRDFEEARAKASARWTLTDSAASEEERQQARDTLGDEEVKRITGLIEQIEKAAAGKKL